MVFDSTRGELVLFGGYLGSGQGYSSETWTFNGAKWTLKQAMPDPSVSSGFAMAFDAARSRVVLLGASSDTWLWDGAAWDRRITTHAPPTRYGHAMTFDRARQKVILFGGGGGPTGFLSDTWAWNGEDWEQITTPSAPPGRLGHMLAFDERLNEVVLFGGFGETGHRDDTWVLNGTGWALRDVSVRPGRRYLGAMEYSRALGKTVLFSGSLGWRYQDVWAWDGAGWAMLTPGLPEPAGRDAHAMAFHTGLGQLVLFGGSAPGPPPNYETIFGDLWLLGSGAPDLAVTAVAEPTVVTGSEIQYAVSAINSGPAPSSGAVFYEYAPAGTSLVNCAGVTTSPAGVGYTAAISDPEGIGQNACAVTFPSFPAGASATITLRVRIACGIANGQAIVASVKAYTATPESQYENNRAVVSVTAVNSPPSVTAPLPVTRDTAASATMCAVVIPDETLGSPAVTDNCAEGVQISRSGVPAANLFPVGITTIRYSALDAGGASGTATQSVTVSDNTSPAIGALSVSPPVLWPPNGKMVAVAVTAPATDNCAGPTTCAIKSISANEGTPKDWEITGALTANLAAKRIGASSDRVYTLTVDCRDSQKNAASKSITVTAPHDQRK